MTMTPKEALDLAFFSQDLYEVLTIRKYFKTLLRTLWEEGEGFSGKRPLGNSGWQYDLEIPLIAAGLLEGTLEVTGEDGNPADYDPDDRYLDVSADCRGDLDAIVLKLIDAL
jgi:hypothetical protein